MNENTAKHKERNTKYLQKTTTVGLSRDLVEQLDSLCVPASTHKRQILDRLLERALTDWKSTKGMLLWLAETTPES